MTDPDKMAALALSPAEDALQAAEMAERHGQTGHAERYRRLASALTPPRAPDGWVVMPGSWRGDVVSYLLHYGGRCRDCADEDGVCPASGLPCEAPLAQRAVKHVLAAIEYGVAQGYLAAAAPAAPPRSPLDREAVARMIYALDPIYDSGETVEGFQVTPGGALSWEQFSDQCAEFGDDPIFHGWNDKREAILAKADQIIALTAVPPEDVGEG